MAAQPRDAVGWLTPTPTKEARPTLVGPSAGRQDTAAHETQFPFGISQLLIASHGDMPFKVATIKIRPPLSPSVPTQFERDDGVVEWAGSLIGWPAQGWCCSAATAPELGPLAGGGLYQVPLIRTRAPIGAIRGSGTSSASKIYDPRSFSVQPSPERAGGVVCFGTLRQCHGAISIISMPIVRHPANQQCLSTFSA